MIERQTNSIETLKKMKTKQKKFEALKAANEELYNNTLNEQWGNQLRLMDIQNRYNEQMAKNNQLRNKDLWDYTNYENQKQHIKNAGLNPALMYGMGGGGGVSANGAQGQGVTQPTDRSVEMKLKQQGLLVV